MKTKFITMFSTTALVALAMFSIAQAQGANMPGGREGGEVERGAPGEPMLISAQEQERDGDGYEEEVRADGQERNQEQERERATSTRSDNDNDQATSTDDTEEKHSAAKEHRSEVATFVKSLLKVADRERGIGEKVREVAHEQDDVASSTAEAIEKVEKRSKVATFFFGSDYKNLGQLRSELVKTENNIEKLKGLVSDAANTANKAELENQVRALETTRAKVDAFIAENESVFSLFGWVAKMFAR